MNQSIIETKKEKNTPHRTAPRTHMLGGRFAYLFPGSRFGDIIRFSCFLPGLGGLNETLKNESGNILFPSVSIPFPRRTLRSQCLEREMLAKTAQEATWQRASERKKSQETKIIKKSCSWAPLFTNHHRPSPLSWQHGSNHEPVVGFRFLVNAKPSQFLSNIT